MSALTADDRDRLDEIAQLLRFATEGPDPHVDNYVRFLRRLASASPEPEIHCCWCGNEFRLLRTTGWGVRGSDYFCGECYPKLKAAESSPPEPSINDPQAEALIEQAAQEFERWAEAAAQEAMQRVTAARERWSARSAALEEAGAYLREKQAAGSGVGTRGDGHGGSAEHDAEVSCSTSAPPASAAPSGYDFSELDALSKAAVEVDYLYEAGPKEWAELLSCLSADGWELVRSAQSPDVGEGEKRCGGSGEIVRRSERYCDCIMTAHCRGKKGKDGKLCRLRRFGSGTEGSPGVASAPPVIASCPGCPDCQPSPQREGEAR